VHVLRQEPLVLALRPLLADPESLPELELFLDTVMVDLRAGHQFVHSAAVMAILVALEGSPLFASVVPYFAKVESGELSAVTFTARSLLERAIVRDALGPTTPS